METHYHTVSPSHNDAAKLLLRVSLAIFMLFHGIAKIGGGIGFITGLLAKSGIPPAVGYLVYVGEVIAPILILVGYWTRPAALIVAINMIVAVLLVHSSELFTLTKNGGWALELQGFYFVTALVVAMQGAGRYSISRGKGKWD